MTVSSKKIWNNIFYIFYLDVASIWREFYNRSAREIFGNDTSLVYFTKQYLSWFCGKYRRRHKTVRSIRLKVASRFALENCAFSLPLLVAGERPTKLFHNPFCEPSVEDSDGAGYKSIMEVVKRDNGKSWERMKWIKRTKIVAKYISMLRIDRASKINERNEVEYGD